MYAGNSNKTVCTLVQTYRMKRSIMVACEVRRDKVCLYMYNLKPSLRQQLETGVSQALAWQVRCMHCGSSAIEIRKACLSMWGTTRLLTNVLNCKEDKQQAMPSRKIIKYPIHLPTQCNRAHLLISMLHQKMGLYHHLSPVLPKTTSAQDLASSSSGMDRLAGTHSVLHYCVL